MAQMAESSPYSIFSWFYLLFVLLCDLMNGSQTTNKKKPNIIIIVADDMGWNDVGFHGSSQIPTPNIDALAYDGIILNQHYSAALCTPSRASLLTGKYPIHTGMQHGVVVPTQAWGLPLEEITMAEYLRDAGYVTRAVGKWHLGHFKKNYTPTYRGFDSHYGFWNGMQDYYDHTAGSRPWKGYDMHRGLSADWSGVGNYSTDLFTAEAVGAIGRHDTSPEAPPLFLYLAHLAPHAGNIEDPLQAPEDAIARVMHIKDAQRRTYAAMVSKLDDSVGEVMDALRRKRMLRNSIVLFLSDNGAPTFGKFSNTGSNFPLRGMKDSPWEGGLRCLAAIWSPLLNRTQRVSHQLMHVTDWLPTLLSAAGVDTSAMSGLDGVDQWRALSEGADSSRMEVLHNIDPIDNYAAIRRGEWKYINGTTMNGEADSWYGDSGRSEGGPQYDIEVILRSKSAMACNSVQGQKILNEGLVRQLRSEAEVRCRDASARSACRPLEAPCLFNVRDDPCETTNLALQRPLVLLAMQEALSKYRALPPGKPKSDDPCSNPAYWNNTWVNWGDHPPPKKVDGVIELSLHGGHRRLGGARPLPS